MTHGQLREELAVFCAREEIAITLRLRHEIREKYQQGG